MIEITSTCVLDGPIIDDDGLDPSREVELDRIPVPGEIVTLNGYDYLVKNTHHIIDSDYHDAVLEIEGCDGDQ